MSVEDKVTYEVGEENFAILTDLVSGLILGWEAREFLTDHEPTGCKPCTAAVVASLAGSNPDDAIALMCAPVHQAIQRVKKAEALIAEWTQPR